MWRRPLSARQATDQHVDSRNHVAPLFVADFEPDA